MKYTITLVIECETAPKDHPDPRYNAEIIGATAMDGAEKFLNPARSPKAISCNVSYCNKIKVKL